MDPVQLIRGDHQQLERLFKRMEHALSRGHSRSRAAALRDITRELSIHAAIEEQFLYPALRNGDAGHPELHAIEEHHAVKMTLAELQTTSPADPRFATKVHLLVRNVRDHIEHEERDLLPMIEDRLEPDELRELGSALANAKLLSPTRPHPRAPEMPPANLVAGPMVGIIDRLRDAFAAGGTALRDAAESTVETALIVARRLSRQAERRGREAVEDLAARSRAVADEARDAGRRTLEDAAGREEQAARQFRASTRHDARGDRRPNRKRTTRQSRRAA